MGHCPPLARYQLQSNKARYSHLTAGIRPKLNHPASLKTKQNKKQNKKLTNDKKNNKTEREKDKRTTANVLKQDPNTQKVKKKGCLT